MRLVLGVPLLLLGCAAGGRPPENGVPSDAPTQPDTMPINELPQDSNLPVDAPTEPDASVVTPDTMPDSPPMPDACVAQVTEVLANPSLDLAPAGTGWTEVPIQNLPGGPYPIITSDGLVQSAPFAAWFGGASGEDADPAATSLTDQLFQDVTFPADATTFVVSGQSAVGGIESTTVVFDRFSIDVIETNGTLIENVMTLNNTQPSATFIAFSKTLTSNLAGRTVRLRLTSTNDISEHTNFFIDSLSFKATFCPP